MNNSQTTMDTKALLLCMIGLSGQSITGELGGITRLQKLLFLLEKEMGITAKNDQFHFEAYKAGPYSSKVYDDLEYLENLGFLRGEIVGESTDEESLELEKLNFDDLIEEKSESNYADAYVERNFSLTDKGRNKIEQLLEKNEYQPFLEGIRKIKSKYGNYSLSDLLFYVYTKYPEMTSNSEIKDKVLSRRG